MGDISKGLVPFDLPTPSRVFVLGVGSLRPPSVAERERAHAEREARKAADLAAKRAADGLCHSLLDDECIDCGREDSECDLPVNHDGDHAMTIRWDDRG